MIRLVPLVLVVVPCKAEASFIAVQHDSYVLGMIMALSALLAIMAFIVHFIFPGKRRIYNWIGKIKKSKKCSACGDSLHWKKHGTIAMEYPENQEEVKNFEICYECITKPRRLRFFPFWLSLRREGWEAEEIQSAWQAIGFLVKIRIFLESQSKLY